MRVRFVVATGLLATACGATVVVQKVPSGPAGDGIHGFRYYLPRPYVAVTTEFPYVSDDVYVHGTLSANGSFVDLDPAVLQRLDLTDPHLPVSQLLHAAPTTGLSGASTGGGGDGGSTDAGTSGGSKGDGGAPSSAEAGASGATMSGTSNGLVVIPNSPFDIIYMPDFDQQYAIDIQGNYSNAELKLALSNGWMLESVDENLQNGQFSEFLMAQAGKTLDILRGLAGMTAGLPPGITGLSGASNQPPPAVLVRARTIQYVVPGVYPILKPSELLACKIDNCAGGVVPFHLRTERFFEVVRVDGGGPSGAAVPNQALKDEATQVLQGQNVKVADVQIVNGVPIVVVQAKTIAAQTEPFRKVLESKLQAAADLKQCTVKWAN